MVKFGLYAVFSIAALVATCSYAMETKRQFYPAAIFMTTSKLSVLVSPGLATATESTLRIDDAMFAGPGQHVLHVDDAHGQNPLQAVPGHPL